MKQPLEHRWKVRVGSPGAISWELYQYLCERGYKSEHKYEALCMEETPIEGVAKFADSLEVYNEFPRTSLLMKIIGLILCLTLILIPLGLWLLRRSKWQFRHIISVNIEGEAYRAGSRTQDPHHAQSEVLGIVSDARVTLKGHVDIRRAGRTKTAKDEVEWGRLKQEFQNIQEAFDSLIPKIVPPEASESLD